MLKLLQHLRVAMPRSPYCCLVSKETNFAKESPPFYTMPFIFKTLGTPLTGASGLNTIYTVQAPATSAIVSNIRLYSAAGTNVDLYFLKDAAATPGVPFARVSCGAAASGIFQGEITLSLGNIIKASSSAATYDVTAFGAERV